MENAQLDSSSLTEQQRAQSRRTLILIFVICAAPVVAALLAFFVWRPGKLSVTGTLIDPPQALALDTVKLADGRPLLPAVQGKWVMAVRAPSSCNDACRQTLYYMRQVRTLQAAQMDRVVRLWVIDDAGEPDRVLLAQHPDLLVVHDAGLASALGEAGHTVFIDSRANLMMRYAIKPDAKGMVKDLQKLLKYTR